MTGKRAREAGFTLVEAMVSLFVFALLSTGCVAMLSQSVGAQGRVSEADGAMRGLQAARSILAADLAQVSPGSIGPNGSTPMAFDGEGAGVQGGRHLRFVRSAGDPDPAAAFATSLVSVEYLIDGAGRLVRRTRPYGGGQAEVSERVLLEGASDVRFQFADGAAWRDDWRTPDGSPPRAVAVLVSVPRYGELRISAFVGLG
jgi:general secretion pathway protein J